jgi:hypothetical protein
MVLAMSVVIVWPPLNWWRYGGLAVPGETSGFQITNIQSNARHALLLAGPLTDSVISNVTNFFDHAEIISMGAKGEGSYKGVTVTNFIG